MAVSDVLDRYNVFDTTMKTYRISLFRLISMRKPQTSRNYLDASLGKTILFNLEGQLSKFSFSKRNSFREVMAHEKLLNMSSRVDWKVGFTILHQGHRSIFCCRLVLLTRHQRQTWWRSSGKTFLPLTSLWNSVEVLCYTLIIQRNLTSLTTIWLLIFRTSV